MDSLFYPPAVVPRSSHLAHEETDAQIKSLVCCRKVTGTEERCRTLCHPTRSTGSQEACFDQRVRLATTQPASLDKTATACLDLDVSNNRSLPFYGLNKYTMVKYRLSLILG